MKNQKLSLLAVVSACWLTLFGCAPSSSDGGGSNNSASVAFPELQGKWTSSCTASFGEGVISSLEISGSDITSTDVYYSNTDCSGSEASKEAGSYSNLVGNSFDAGGAKNYTTSMKIQKFDITPLNSISKDAMNTESYCGVTSWESNTPLDALGKTCDFVAIPQKDTTIYRGISLTGNTIIVSDYGTDSTYSISSLVRTPLSYQKQ